MKAIVIPSDGSEVAVFQDIKSVVLSAGDVVITNTSDVVIDTRAEGRIAKIELV